MMDIVFVILNFNLFNETVNCITSICNNLDTLSFHIIVVDNASKNGVGEKLKQFYKDNTFVTVLQNLTNEGFARGNNLGITKARTLLPKFICCLNNDTILEQKDFFVTLNQYYEKDHPAIIGPKIVLKDGRTQHVNKVLQSIKYYKNQMEGLENKETSFRTIKEKLLQNRIIYELNFLRKKYRNEKHSEFTDVILHGCCLIFTPVFFDKLDGFDNRTFLYAEEQLLYVSLMKNELHNKYCPYIRIRHLEDMSTKSISKSSKERIAFINKNTVLSLRILIDELEKNKEILYR